MDHLEGIAVSLWRSPPAHGVRIAALVMGDAGMFTQWKSELRDFVGGIKKVSSLPWLGANLMASLGNGRARDDAPGRQCSR